MTDQQLDQIIGRLLQIGVLLSAAVVLAGGVWLLAGSGDSTPAYQRFLGEPAELRSVGGLLGSMSHPRAETVIQLGLLLLVATPVARVILTVAAFAVARDRLYVVITLIVLAVLMYSLAIPHG